MNHGLYHAGFYRSVLSISKAKLAAALPVFIERERVVIALLFINNLPGAVVAFF
jgi:hypothetical protein